MWHYGLIFGDLTCRVGEKGAGARLTFQMMELDKF